MQNRVRLTPLKLQIWSNSVRTLLPYYTTLQTTPLPPHLLDVQNWHGIYNGSENSNQSQP